MSEPESRLDLERTLAILRAREAARSESRIAGQVVELRRDDGLVVVVGVEGLRTGALHPYTEKFSMGQVGVVFIGAPPDDLIERLPERSVVATVPSLDCPNTLRHTVSGTLERIELRLAAERRSRSIRRYRYELSELVEIARALTQERDLNRLLDLILEKSRFITGADAGSIYVVEHGGEGTPSLRFKLSQNDSCDFEAREFLIPISRSSIAGAAVIARAPINIADVNELGDEQPFEFDRSFDARTGYRTRSMMTVPLISAEDEVIGVIQLINKKEEPERRLETPEDFAEQVLPFDQRSVDLLKTLASQAGIALENALLYAEIKTIFEGFVRASVQAIEQRDPTTSGHSLRVSVLSCRLAEAVDRTSSGPYREVLFSRRDLQELEFAALLHDFGKIGVREQVLVKAKKLYPHELAQVRARFEYAAVALELNALRRRERLLARGAAPDAIIALTDELEKSQRELQEAWSFVSDSNEPTVLTAGNFARLSDVAGLSFPGPDGEPRPLLTPSEVASLQVRRGTLKPDELDEIRSHVVHTYEFLSRIPWGKNLSRVPAIAGAHHERLNGTGYPHGWTGDEIPLASKIMTVADIYDALTARDRPYKKAVPVDRALSILGFEVKDGHIDAELVQTFIDAKIYEEVRKDLSY